MIDLPPAASALAAAAASAAAALALTPAAARLSGATGLLDRPAGWKTHRAPTPYLGGLALLGSAAIGVALFGEGSWPLAIVAAALCLAAIGTFDDAVRLHAWPRLAFEVAAGVALWKAGLGWELSAPDALELLLTVTWVVAAINAFNLLDLMDGVATATLGAVALGVAALAAVDGNEGLLAGSAAMAGACLGFLRHNLASPARIFMGDGGSMPLGLLAAAGICAALSGRPGEVALPAAALLFAVPLLDATYRALLRVRAGVSLMRAGPDSLANRLGDRLGTKRGVSLLLAAVQLTASGIAVTTVALGGSAAPALGAVALTLALAAAIRATGLSDGSAVAVSEVGGLLDEVPGDQAPVDLVAGG